MPEGSHGGGSAAFPAPVDLKQYLNAPVGPANPVDTEEVSPTAIIHGQVTLTGAAQQLPVNACKSVTLENINTNNVVYVGNSNAVSAANGYMLQPGATVSFDIDNTNRVWLIGTLNNVVSFIGVN